MSLKETWMTMKTSLAGNHCVEVVHANVQFVRLAEAVGQKRGTVKGNEIAFRPWERVNK